MLKFSYVAIAIAVIANFGLGGIWYQVLFRNPVRREFTAKYSTGDFIIDIARSFVTVSAFAVTMARAESSSWADATLLASFLWIGFMAPAQLSEKLFGGRSWTFYLINTGYLFVSLLVAATVLSLWSRSR
jgi:ABC-type Fe3+-siderophore transport system permease subunit